MLLKDVMMRTRKDVVRGTFGKNFLNIIPNKKEIYSKTDKFYALNKYLLIFIFLIFLNSCGNSTKDDFDFSDFKIPKKEKTKITQNNIITSDNSLEKKIKNKLIPYKSRSEILNSHEFGKTNPFSKGEKILNRLDSDLKLTGFLSTKTNKYVFVNYLGEVGKITKDSIGGINTDLLPDGAKIINIDQDNKQLIIRYNNQNYYFEL